MIQNRGWQSDKNLSSVKTYIDKISSPLLDDSFNNSEILTPTHTLLGVHLLLILSKYLLTLPLARQMWEPHLTLRTGTPLRL